MHFVHPKVIVSQLVHVLVIKSRKYPLSHKIHMDPSFVQYTHPVRALSHGTIAPEPSSKYCPLITQVCIPSTSTYPTIHALHFPTDSHVRHKGSTHGVH